jgi:hypothetical protein
VTRRWKDIDSFVVVRTSALSGLVGIRLSGSPEQTSNEQTSNVRRAARAIAGYDGGALPDTYGMTAVELTALMNDWRDRYANQPQEREAQFCESSLQLSATSATARAIRIRKR